MPVNTIRKKLDYLMRKTGRSEADIVAQAVNEGVSELYRKQITDAYLAGELDRKKAIQELGKDLVDDLDFAKQSADSDIKWGLNNA